MGGLLNLACVVALGLCAIVFASVAVWDQVQRVQKRRQLDSAALSDEGPTP